ncbi:Pentapeptide repeat protein [Trichormus variabilis ATCC 29413]|uniref:Pentapeptide repeat protein n=2 Tax=Anabaena variabilis TaxID=264691 RepID=Q3M803_TRIV2|nr:MULTISPECIES: NACHT domain-containing protein [Nostocaceae]ABA22883.1 Pentapeptide repeat protein [Trichormus variabilis ATCC 29413]MBC1212912.1 NACHT domain-containing protein [Trichormus variabilis ARAD]MBC1256766.1 NACHT domain-containing protein [Trichormus variabilis V5]MBC1268116.1 NACHT domain-containing protein [Trichormus variabilis FSR]MBC1303426.1 NACHT domain-containing protein [Trichormus variabilis N2B]
MSLINLDLVISAVTSIANPVIKEKILRSETVIKLLQQFNLDPEHPPADFSGVYAYTLVEYGVGKPKAFLELFRQEAIKQAFRKALGHNNPSILLSEVDAFLDSYTLGDEIRSLELDVRREVAAFATVFIEVAKRSRTPADVLMSQQIGSLHKRIASIQEQLERLPTLEGIRTEIARLAAQNYPALAGATTENQCRAIALAQQMRGWFETLGYRLEKYEIWAEDYFEWIINVPVRRSYDRILVRGVAGEVRLSDVMALRQSVNQQKTDEGWLVSNRRIARAARDEVKKEENRHLDCFTFDELIDLDADFTGYLDWLEAEIKRRKIDQKYVPLACTKEEIDPVTKRRIGVSRYEAEDGWIDGYIDLWLDDPAKEHISILGEFGTGKTWFVFHYAWTALQRYKDAQKRGVERPRLPLVITLRDFAKALNVENVLAGFFFTQHNIRLNSEVFDQLNRMGKLLLIFDGFDEMAAKIDRQQMINNFWELAKVVVPGSKVILTCRTEHFPESKEGRALLNAELQASTNKLTGETPQFEVLELEKFNDEQIRQVLLYQAEAATVEQVMDNSQLLDLARRPVMTDLILEALPDIESGKPIDMSRVYLYAVRRKMERDIKAERTFTSLADKLYFLCELSWEMLSTDQMSLNYRLFPERIRRLFDSVVQEEKDLDHWHYDMMGQTMLVRNADGDYTPAHRSLLEFFVAYKFAAELGALAEDFTALAQAQSGLDSGATPVDYTWFGYFSRQWNDIIAPLKAFTRESFEKLRETFGKAPLTKAVIDLLVPMLSNNESLISVIERTRGQSEDAVGYIGGNAATLVLRIDPLGLEGKDLSGTVIKGADFTNVNLQNVNFFAANLVNCAFTRTLGAVFSVAFNSDCKLLATGDGNGIVRLLDAATCKEILICKGHGSIIPCVAFSPSAQILASGSYDQTIKLWSIQTGECLKILQGHVSGIRSIAFSPSGAILASSGNDNIIRLWNIDTGESLKTLHGHRDHVYSVAFDPSGMILVSGSGDQTIRIWDINSGKCLKILEGHTNAIRSIALNSTGEIIASSSSDHTIGLWDIKTGKCLNILRGHTDNVMSVVFNNSDRIIASGGADHTVRLWDVQSGECLNVIQGHTNVVRSVAFNSSGQTLASGSYDKTLKIWDINTYECLTTVQGHTNWISSVAFNPSGRTFASGGNDATIIWDANTGKCLKTLQIHTAWVFSVAFSSCGKMLASSSADAKVRLWNIDTGECLKILNGHTYWVFSVAFSADGKLLASSGSDKTLKVWSIETGQCLTTIHANQGTVHSVAFNPVNRTLANGGFDSQVKLWDVNTGECLKILQGHSGTIRSVDFHPGGKILASGSADCTIRLWDVDTSECVKILQGHSKVVQSIAFSSDGQILATGSEDFTIKLWNIFTGECFQTLWGHTTWVLSVAFSPDCKTLISGSQDETIKVWDIKTGDCIKTLRSDRFYERMNITRVKGLISSEIATLKSLGAIEE